MDSFLGRFRNPLLLLAVVLLQTLWLATQVQHPLHPGLGFASGQVGSQDARSGDGHNVSLLREWTMFVASPVERVAHGSGLATRHLWFNYADLRHTRQQNLALQSEVARLRQEQAAFAEDAAEGRRLQTLLAFKQHYIATTVAAQVIGTSGSDRSHVLWIDKGSDDGLKSEQPVITPDGVVGKLRDVMPHTAQLLLISDPNSGAGVILASTRMRGIIRGTAAGEVQINNLTADQRIKPGEAIITSGGDQVFPRGLPVGTIASIAPDPQHQPYTAISIKPAANLRQLEEVLVITGTVPTLPTPALADAAQAEATAAEANQRAADLVAARLPGLHDNAAGSSPDAGDGAGASGAGSSGTGSRVDLSKAAAAAANTPGGVPGVPNSGMPKVKPAVHADRYSPGTTPPASDLTPGAPAAPRSPSTTSTASGH